MEDDTETRRSRNTGACSKLGVAPAEHASEELDEQEPADEYLPDRRELYEAFGVDLQRTAAAGDGDWNERRKLQRARLPHMRRALRVATRCVELARRVEDAIPGEPGWNALTDEIARFYSSAYPGMRPETVLRMQVLAQVARQALLALHWRYLQATARLILGDAAQEDIDLIRRESRRASLRRASAQQFGNPPQPELAKTLLAESIRADPPEQKLARTVVSKLRRLLAGTMPPERLGRRLDQGFPLIVTLLREWPSKGGRSQQNRDDGSVGGGKWAMANALVQLLGLGRVTEERLRKDWQEFLRQRRARRPGP